MAARQLSRAKSLNGQLTGFVQELVENGITLEQARREFERQFILAALRAQDGNLIQSAARLGVHRNTLRNKMDSLAISAADYA